MTIRPANAEDLPRLVEVCLASFGTITWQRKVDEQFGPLNRYDWRERWKRRVVKAFTDQQFLVLVEEGAILGCACGTVDKTTGLGHLDILAIDPAAQGKGRGKALLRAMEDFFASQGATHLTLESLVDNEAANALYRKEGFQPIASHYNWFKKIGS